MWYFHTCTECALIILLPLLRSFPFLPQSSLVVLYVSLFMCVCVHVCVPWLHVEVRGRLWRVRFSPSVTAPHGFRVLNLDLQAQWQVPLPDEPSSSRRLVSLSLSFGIEQSMSYTSWCLVLSNECDDLEFHCFCNWHGFVYIYGPLWMWTTF